MDKYLLTQAWICLLYTSGKSASKFIEGENKVKYYAQELKQNTYNLTRMNLVMRGIEAVSYTHLDVYKRQVSNSGIPNIVEI